PLSTCSFSFFQAAACHRALPSFPTRRSSDLPVVRVYDSRGKQIAFASSQPWFAGDARCVATLPADGKYSVEVHDRVYRAAAPGQDRKSTRLNSSHVAISYAVFCLKKKIQLGL